MLALSTASFDLVPAGRHRSVDEQGSQAKLPHYRERWGMS